MKTRAQTIQIFLPDGNPRGVRIADMLSRTVKVVLCPRNQFEYILKREEIASIGFYFLFGESEEGKALVYIGEGENCLERLKSHQKNKDFWNYAAIIISKTQSLTKTHIKFLEFHSFQKVKIATRYILDNSNEPSKPYVTESMEAEILDCFDTVQILLSTLGFPVFESISREAIMESPSDIFFLKRKGKDAYAEGDLIDDGFVVFKGSRAAIKTTLSCPQGIIDIRESLIKRGVLIQEENEYIVTEDSIFSSPSTASSILLGHSSNGWTAWVNEDGETLDKVKRSVI